MSHDNPFAPPLPPAYAHEAVFGSRYPSLLLAGPGGRMVAFRYGEYRTADPVEIDFLLRVVADESRANRGVWVRQLPPPPLATERQGEADEAEPEASRAQEAEPENPAAPEPPAKTAKPRKPKHRR